MFEICAVLGARSQRLRQYGHLVGVLYHGCDDVGDQRGLDALGGGGEEDIRDGILTLPAALAIRDPEIRALFLDRRRRPGAARACLAAACRAQLDDAEQVLDRVADCRPRRGAAVRGRSRAAARARRPGPSAVSALTAAGVSAPASRSLPVRPRASRAHAYGARRRSRSHTLQRLRVRARLVDLHRRAEPRRATIAAAASSPLVTADSIVVIPIRLAQKSPARRGCRAARGGLRAPDVGAGLVDEQRRVVLRLVDRPVPVDVARSPQLVPGSKSRYSAGSRSIASASSSAPVPGSPYGSEDDSESTVPPSKSRTPSQVWEMSVKARPSAELEQPDRLGRDAAACA